MMKWLWRAYELFPVRRRDAVALGRWGQSKRWELIVALASADHQPSADSRAR